MPVLNTNAIDAVKLGSTNIDAIYKAGAKIWPTLTPDLLAEYRFADGNTLGDTSDNDRTAVLTDPVNLTKSYSLPAATGAGLSYTFYPRILSSEFSAEAWICPQTPTTSPIEAGYLIAMAESPAGLVLYYQGNAIWCRVVESDASYQDTPTVNITPGTPGQSSGVTGDTDQWIHVAYTMKYASFKFWVDGQLAHSLTRITALPMDIRVIQLCKSTNGPGAFKVAGCRFWNTEKYTANFTPDTGLLNP